MTNPDTGAREPDAERPRCDLGFLLGLADSDQLQVIQVLTPQEIDLLLRQGDAMKRAYDMDNLLLEDRAVSLAQKGRHISPAGGTFSLDDGYDPPHYLKFLLLLHRLAVERVRRQAAFRMVEDARARVSAEVPGILKIL